MPPADYISLLKTEIAQKSLWFNKGPVDTIYFGGGTPSLIAPDLIVSVIQELSRHGFVTGPSTEITIEINPATIDEEKLKTYLGAGFNRFSVGAQTFDDKLLKSVNREHNSRQTLETLELLQKFNLNYTFDILFALPGQTLAGLKKDLEITAGLGAKHISPYCLTVPNGHPLSKGRPPEEEQVEMFDLIAEALTSMGYKQYEISNFARPGFESKHNLLYWTDENYWGLGLSAHSYKKNKNARSVQDSWGTRFWNINSIGEYQKQISTTKIQGSVVPMELLNDDQFEVLECHQSLTDFCHTALRMMKGLDEKKLISKFGNDIAKIVLQRLQKQVESGHVIHDQEHWFLSTSGLLLSNKVFESVTFAGNEITSATH